MTNSFNVIYEYKVVSDSSKILNNEQLIVIQQDSPQIEIDNAEKLFIS